MKTIGINSTLLIDDNYLGRIKQLSLLFDQIGVPILESLLENNVKVGAPSHINAEIEYLINEEIVRPVGKTSTSFREELNMELIKNTFNLFLSILKKNDFNPLMKIEFWARFNSFLINHERGMEGFIAYPVHSIPSLTFESLATKETVHQIILEKVPIPSETTPWEDIINFRKDKDSVLKLLTLKNWITDITKGNYTNNEIFEKTDFLIEQYSRCLELHKMKTKKGIIQTIVIGGIEIAENIAKLNVTKLAKLPFKLNDKKVDLLISEMQSPGAELSYLYTVKEKFA